MDGSESVSQIAEPQRLSRHALVCWTVRRSAVVRCRQGTLWLTNPAQPGDFLISQGETLTLKPGRWVAQALDSAVFVVVRTRSEKEANNGQAALVSVF